MRRRIHRKSSHIDPDIDIRPVDGTASLVTFDDPHAPLTLAQDAFVRIRPPEGMSPDDVASWRERVAAAGARAIRVIAAPKASLVPAAAARLDDVAPVGTFRQEALALAEETGAAAVVTLTRAILDEVGA